ncbi:hypothetical protein GGQ73_003220 [Rhizobium skierniewicense]|uniref:ParB-like N-terminal domain-containing protein n=1 Tax=Rhizobium skierniewicense TaxID=984260 RepID=A0A7W6G395_9HYPH|nr:ParB N-terminal domain-containing protein [Rhizobium skierniewicense]MBB3947254.1 hypothetical protein [Rhizobium skierniewicense]
MQIEFLSPLLIDIPSDHRKVHPDAVQALAESITKLGQRQPIEVIQIGERYRLVFGATRLGAATALKRDVSAIVKQPDAFRDEADIRLTTISENFYRRDLSVLDRSIDIADWCAIHRAAQPVMKPGPKPRKSASDELSINLIPNSDDEQMEMSNRFAMSFSEAAQHFLKISRVAVFRALKIANIAADLRDRIAVHEALADNQQALLDIAAQPYERAARIIELLLSGEAESFAQAVEIIDQLPRSNPPAAWERVNDRFSRLKPTEQDAFFNINESAVMRWVAERRAAKAAR